MDTYRLVLFVHVLSLVVAAGATAIMKLALGRRAAARTAVDALDWHTVLSKTSMAFPIVLATFVLTGGYMLGVTHLPWSTGFIVGGLTGVGLLLLSGIVLGVKGKALMKVLEAEAAKGKDHPAPRLAPPRLIALLPFANTGLVLGVVFDMVTKPIGIPGALTPLAVGIILGALSGKRIVAKSPSPAPADA